MEELVRQARVTTVAQRTIFMVAEAAAHPQTEETLQQAQVETVEMALLRQSLEPQ